MTPTLSSYVQISYNLPAEFRFIVAAVAGLYSIWCALKVQSLEDIAVVVRRIMIPLSLVAAPYAWSYDFVMLLFSISFLTATAKRSQGTLFGIPLGTLIVLLIFNVCLAALPLQMYLHWWYPLGVLLLCCTARNQPTVKVL